MCEVHSLEAQAYQKAEINQDYRMLPLPPHLTTTVTKGLFTAVPFTQYVMSGYQEKVTRHTKRQKIQFEETEQASEPDSNMAVLLELPDR